MTRKTAYRDDVRDTFRAAVLEALDKAAHEWFSPPRNDAGANDSDLPRLFASIDNHVETLASRYGVTLLEFPPAETV
jgi:hypothetical protein